MIRQGKPIMTVRHLLPLVLLSLSPLGAEVRVWQGTLPLPTYQEDLPDVNPPFDQFANQRFNYPYTLRENILPRAVDQNWRALFLENEYLKCSVLPDLGGHIYSCTDKLSGREMFYANPSLKKANISYRGAWAAFGVEFNFPVSHNWVSMSPVDFSMRRNEDGSASVFVGNVDRPYGMQWQVELVLRPGSTVLEERVTLYNRSDVRHRYYWWNNAGVEVWDDTRVYYPTQYFASHGFTFIDTWPVNKAGLDLSVIGNQTAGPVSQFVYGSREPYMGLYHPHTGTGIVHFAPYGDLPAKKLWTWGVDAEGLDWRNTLSDNHSAYAEVQAGLFRNQETYAFLPPQETIRFSEYWMPVREIGGITRANLHGVVYLHREKGSLIAALNVNHEIPDARIRILDGSKVLFETRQRLAPETIFTHTLDAAPSVKCRFELAGADGVPLLVHTEDEFDWTPASEVKVGPQVEVWRQVDPLEVGEDEEVNGALLDAWATYEAALRNSPDNFELNKAAGRLAVGLRRYEDAVRLLAKAQYRLNNDPEIHYYLGIAWAALNESRKARTEWEGAQRQPQFRAAARFELARLSAREGDRAGALKLLQAAVAERPGMVRAGGMEVALLRELGQTVKARQRVDWWLSQDPASTLLRHEKVLLGGNDDGLWRHLAADPDRVIATAADYMEIGAWADAASLLARQYPAVQATEAEPGAVLPQDNPLVAYYRGYCSEKLGRPGKPDFEKASHQSPRYVFPSRPSSLVVLRRAIQSNPEDATAHLLLGELLMSGGMADAALKEWETARSLNPRLPALQRNIALTLMAVKRDVAGAVEVYREGLDRDPENLEIYTGLNVALSLLRRPAAERADTLLRYPKRERLTTPMLFDLALSLAEAGRLDEAEAMFRGHFFARAEGEVNERQVYLEVELQKALRLAASRRSTEAEAVVSGLGKEAPGLAFTKDGMEPLLKETRIQYVIGRIEALCGNAHSARQYWQAAATGEGPFAILAAKELGTADWRALAERETSRASDHEQPPVRRSPGDGLLLHALGRDKEAAELLSYFLLQPDRQFSHYIARRALLELEDGAADARGGR
jgi:tetratricopeptide (TPR) repeat protein